MSEMVERAALSMARVRWPDIHWDDVPITDQFLLADFAKAAILAMREPTEAMISAATVLDGGCGQAEVARMNFTFMVDEALK